MITNKNQLLILATNLSKLGLTRTECCMVYKRRTEADDFIIQTKTSNAMHFRLLFIVWPIHSFRHICVLMVQIDNG